MLERAQGKHEPALRGLRDPGADAAGGAVLGGTFNKRRTNSWPNKSTRVTRADSLV